MGERGISGGIRQRAARCLPTAAASHKPRFAAGRRTACLPTVAAVKWSSGAVRQVHRGRHAVRRRCCRCCWGHAAAAQQHTHRRAAGSRDHNAVCKPWLALQQQRQQQQHGRRARRSRAHRRSECRAGARTSAHCSRALLAVLVGAADCSARCYFWNCCCNKLLRPAASGQVAPAPKAQRREQRSFAQRYTHHSQHHSSPRSPAHEPRSGCLAHAIRPAAPQPRVSGSAPELAGAAPGAPQPTGISSSQRRRRCQQQQRRR